MTAVVEASDRLGSRVSASYPGFDQVLASVRHDIVGWCRDQGLSTVLTGRAELVISELASNAIQASPGSAFEVVFEARRPFGARIAVTNTTAGPSPPPRRAWRPTGPLAVRGRGLLIVAAVADEVIVDRARSGLVTVAALLNEHQPPVMRRRTAE